jgi:hypothetical protein
MNNAIFESVGASDIGRARTVMPSNQGSVSDSTRLSSSVSRSLLAPHWACDFHDCQHVPTGLMEWVSGAGGRIRTEWGKRGESREKEKVRVRARAR